MSTLVLIFLLFVIAQIISSFVSCIHVPYTFLEEKNEASLKKCPDISKFDKQIPLYQVHKRLNG